MADTAASAHDLTPAAAPTEARWRIILRTAFPFVVVGALWEIVALAHVFPPRLFPPL
jgi:hypothetical protein